ncbi:hypothetical protein AAJP84_06700 [Bartonella schoenbuchensis]|uniref:hypothetical protein n=1 Tax=Bartonella schoenbuchensis TaxID=165694 RepID=UPI0031CC3EF6
MLRQRIVQGLASSGGGGGDQGNGPIVCDGGANGRGVQKGVGELSGKRDIDMSGHSDKAAVTVTGPSTNITIKSELRVWDSSGSSQKTAIKVYDGGKLALVGKVSVTDVKKGIEVSGSGSSVTVVKGTIGVRAGRDAGPVIEVSKEGKVVLMEGVKVTGSGNVNGVGVINNGGTVELMGTGLSVSKGTGIKIMGTGTATVRGGGATITLQGGGTGMDVEGNANVVELEIKGNGGNGMGVLINGSGTVTLTKVTMKDVAMGARVTNGTLKILGESTIDVTESGTGFNVTGGKVVMMGTMVTVGRDGTGMSVSGGGTVEMMGTTVTGRGNTGTGVEVKGGTANVTLTSVTMKDVDTGVEVDGGKVKILGESTIDVTGSGKGIYAKSGKVEMEGTTTINVTGSGKGVMVDGSGTVMMEGTTKITVGGNGKGMYVTGGDVTMTGTTKIEVTGVGTGMEVGGSAMVMMTGGSLTVKGNGGGTGIYAKSGTLMMDGVNISKVGTGIWMEGGVLMVKDGTIEGNGNTGTGVFATGGSGNVTLEGVNISEVATGVQMEGTGTLMVEGGTIGFVGSGKGVYVGSSVTEATLTNVTIMGKGKGDGIYVKGGAVTMTSVNISNVGEGVYMEGGKSLMVRDGEIRFTGTYGVMVGSSVTSASLMGVEITGKGSGKGVWVKGGAVTMTSVNISEVGTGIWMEAGESLTVSGGKIGFKGTYGVYVEGGVKSTTLAGVEITGSGKGSGTGMGVWVEGGKVTVKGGTRITGVKAGIYATGGGSLTVEEGTKIEFVGNYGVMVEGGTAELTGVTIEGRGGNGSGYGVYAMGGEVTVSGGRITGVEAGIKMMGGKSLTVKDGTRIEFEGKYGYGIYVGEGVRADLTGVTIEGRGKGSGTGVYAMGGKMVMKQVGISNVATGVVMSGGAMWLKETHLRDVAKGMTIEEGVVRMEGGSVEFKGEHGISLTGGYADLRGVNMTYTSNGPNANFIKVEGGKVLAEGITITGNGGKGQGVKVANGGAVWLKETNFTNVRSGISISEGSVFMFKGGITFKGEYGIYLSKGQALLSDFNITGPGGTSKTTATGIGVVVNSLGEVMMREVNISGVEMGARVTSGLLVMDKGSITFKGKHGINLIRGHALLNGVNITGPGSGTGIELGYGQVLMKGTTFTNVDKAITVTEGDVRMEGGEITFTGEHGILLNQGGVALMGVRMTYLCFHVCFFFCIVCECFVYFFLF